MTSSKVEDILVSDVIRKNLTYKEYLIGPELEVEFKDGTELKGAYPPEWRTTRDGSLRNYGIEFIANGPMTRATFKKTLPSILEYCKKNGAIKNNPRTSFHVHVNVGDMPIVKYYNFLVLYYLLENVLFLHCGENRHNNMFCLPIAKASLPIDTLLKSINKDEPLRFTSRNDSIRYSGLNLCATYLFGTLEFRGMNGDMDLYDTLEWENIIKRLYDLSFTYDSPHDIFQRLENMGPRHLVEQVFSPKFCTEHAFRIPSLVEENVPIVAPILRKVRDWDNWKGNFSKYRVRKEENFAAGVVPPVTTGGWIERNENLRGYRGLFNPSSTSYDLDDGTLIEYSHDVGRFYTYNDVNEGRLTTFEEYSMLVVFPSWYNRDYFNNGVYL